jgi:hypothetical protein
MEFIVSLWGLGTALVLCVALYLFLMRVSGASKLRATREGKAAFQRREVCSGCGYVHYAPSPHPLVGPRPAPDVCPKCGHEMTTHVMRRVWKEKKFAWHWFEMKGSQWWEYRGPTTRAVGRSRGPYCPHVEHEHHPENGGACPAENRDCVGGH